MAAQLQAGSASSISTVSYCSAIKPVLCNLPFCSAVGNAVAYLRGECGRNVLSAALVLHLQSLF